MNNIYSKMQKARCEFQEKPLKKSGHMPRAGSRKFTSLVSMQVRIASCF